MAFTFNGIGTKFYGNCDRRSDGSYVTTEWFTIFYLPIVPIRSLRLAPVKGGVTLGVYNSQLYVIFEKLPIHWPQVGRIYGFVLGGSAWMYFWGWLLFDRLHLMDGPNEAWGIGGMIGAALALVVAVWWFRRRAALAAREAAAATAPLPGTSVAQSVERQTLSQ